MQQIKAVELMRKIREGFESRDANLSLKERAHKMREELEANPAWKDFLKHRQRVAR